MSLWLSSKERSDRSGPVSADHRPVDGVATFLRAVQRARAGEAPLLLRIHRGDESLYVAIDRTR